MTSAWLVTLTLLASLSPVQKATTALEARHFVAADTLAQSYLQHPPSHHTDDDMTTMRLVSAFARLHGGNQAEDALTGLDLLAQEHIHLGPQGIFLRVLALARLDACQQAYRVARTLPKDSLWTNETYQQVAACMLRHNPTPPVVGPLPAGVREVRDTLAQLGHKSQSPQASARSLLQAGKLSAAWGDFLAADEVFAEVTNRYGSLADGLRAKSARLALRRQHQLSTPLVAQAEPEDAASQRRILLSRTERAALLRRARFVRAHHGPMTADYAQATLDLVHLALVDSHYATAQNLLAELAHALPDTADDLPQALMMAGDTALLQGHEPQALALWQRAAHLASPSPWGTVALLHAAAATAALDPQTAQCALDEATKRLPLHDELLVMRDDGAAVVLTPAMAQAEAARIAAALGGAKTAARPIEAAQVVPTQTAHSLRANGRGGHTLLSGRPTLRTPDLATIELLIDHHLPHTARSLMRRLPAQDLSAEERLMAAYFYARLGDTFRATLLMQQCDAGCQALDATAEALVYPTPYKEQVLTQSLRAHIPAALVYAIMREESGFNAGATSGRHAVGLMQLMPATASHLAQQAHMPAPSQRALLRPDVNIALGIQLLRQLYRHFDGDVAAVAAAYQAGQPKAQRWLELAQKGSLHTPLSTVIPLMSSRIYVEHIERAFERYQARLQPSAMPHQI